jgi:hypothetical protein
MRREYQDGRKAADNFEKLAKAVLRAGNPKKQPKKKSAKRRTKIGSDKG